MFFITAGEAAEGARRSGAGEGQGGDKSISTPVFHNQGSYQLDSEAKPSCWRAESDAGGVRVSRRFAALTMVAIWMLEV